jgi:hypothetical protein
MTEEEEFITNHRSSKTKKEVEATVNQHLLKQGEGVKIVETLLLRQRFRSNLTPLRVCK